MEKLLICSFVFFCFNRPGRVRHHHHRRRRPGSELRPDFIEADRFSEADPLRRRLRRQVEGRRQQRGVHVEDARASRRPALL